MGFVVRTLEVIPSIPTIEVEEVKVGPPNSGNTEYVPHISNTKNRPNFNSGSYPGLPLGDDHRVGESWASSVIL